MDTGIRQVDMEEGRRLDTEQYRRSYILYYQDTLGKWGKVGMGDEEVIIGEKHI